VAAVTQTRLIGIGLYTLSEASRLLGVSASKISRWLRGHEIGGQHYDQLWQPQIDLGDGHVYLGFRDLMVVRVASAFIERGLSAQKVCRAIDLAREMVGEERPLSTTEFRTDGQTVFLQLTEEDGSDTMVDLFLKQHVFREIIEPSLENIDFVDGIAARWWPNGKHARIGSSRYRTPCRAVCELTIRGDPNAFVADLVTEPIRHDRVTGFVIREGNSMTLYFARVSHRPHSYRFAHANAHPLASLCTDAC
jgi:hypothetical protein